MRGLYVHVPFCVKKCSYCDFYSLSGRSASIDSYLDAVICEAGAYQGMGFETLYLGGGTPSLLGGTGLRKLMSGLKGLFDVSGLKEATMEANPESADAALLEAALEAGINRISIGVQSLSADELSKVGRIHSNAQAVLALEEAYRAGFRNISADAILGLPGQTEETLAVTLETLLGLDITHLSLYCLALEPHTPLAQNPPGDLPDEDTQADLYDMAVELIERRGLERYEISNFALTGYECAHNLNYWRGGEYLGLGPAAASHLGGKRYRNRADLDAYLADPGGQAEEREELEPRRKAAEEAVLRLRLLKEGADSRELAERYGDENVMELVGRLDEQVKAGVLLRDGPRYLLKPEFALVSNPILARLVE